MSYIHTGGSGGALYFPSAAAADIPGARVETKLCELCGRTFTRPAMAEMRRQRDCPRCVERQAERTLQEARELAAFRHKKEN
jgi:hypothetical protein